MFARTLCRRLAVLAAAVVTFALAAPAGAVHSGPLTWHKAKVVDPLRGGFASVTCVSATFCLAGDQNGKVWRYDGRRWSTQAVVDTDNAIVSDITCVTTSFCVAGLDSREGSNAPLTYRNGKWHARPFAEHNGTAGIDCTSTQFCLMMNGDGTYQTYDGSAWSAAHRTGGDFGVRDVSCATSKFCIATDLDFVFRYNGKSWSTRQSIDSEQFLTSVSCPSRSWCLAVDSRGRSVRYANGEWQAPVTRRRDKAGYSAVECLSAGRCIAVDFDGRARAYSHGKWHAPHQIVTDELADVSCSSLRSCVAVSYFGEAATMTAAGWQHRTRPDPLVGGPTAVSCASAHSCVVVDASGAWLRYNGSVWTEPKRTSYHPFGYFAELACPTTSFCMGVTLRGRARALTGNHWTHPRSTGVNLADAVACESARRCIAVGIGPASVWNGSRWNVAHSTTGDHITTISCARTFCLAGTANGSVVTYRHGQWSSPHRLVPSHHRVLGVSCSRAVFCLAYGANGQAFKRVSGTWSPAGRAFQGARRVHGMSCTSHSFCVATSKTAVSTYNGHSWTAAKRVTKEPGFLNDISCAHQSLCVALTENTDSALIAD